MKILVIGTGYVGLVTGTCFSQLGFSVTCVDKDPSKIKKLNRGMIPIYEPGLEEIIKTNSETGKLRFTTEMKDVISDSDAIFIAVGTPSSDETGEADLTAVQEVATEIAPLLQGYTVIVVKSTVPVGTSKMVQKLIAHHNPNAHFDMVSNPEFLREGVAISDFLNPDRVIVGVEAPRAKLIMKQIYLPFTERNIPVFFTDLHTSEMIKYSSNCFLATKIAFINELALLCEKVGADVEDVAHGMGLDKRIGTNHLKPGPGFGGSCFPKDTRALVHTAQNEGVPLSIVERVIASNEAHKHKMAEKIKKICAGVQGKRLCIWGVAFKANTDDIRESSAMLIMESLIEAGAILQAYDPAAIEKAALLLPKINWFNNPIDALKGSHACIILTEWDIFKNVDTEVFLRHMDYQEKSKPILIDYRNLYSLDSLDQRVAYFSLGRSPIGF